jgi:cobalt-zinc-cadmium efflux system membrane fusion protein
MLPFRALRHRCLVRDRLRWQLWLLLGLALSSSETSFAHEGHQPLPTKGVQVDVKTGHLTLSRAARDVLDIQAIEVRTGSVPAAVHAYATVESPWARHAFATARLSGRVVRLAVRPGDFVEAGQVLAEVDSLELRSLRQEFQMYQAQLELTGKLLTGVERAAGVGSIPGQRLVEAETAHRQNENALTVLRAKAAGLHVPEELLSASSANDANRLTLPIQSPIRGAIVHADVAIGKVVEPTEHLFEIVDTSQVWLRMGVLEQDLYRVKESQLAVVSFPGTLNERLTAPIDKRGLFLAPDRHQGVLWASYQNESAVKQVLPGMQGVASIVDHETRELVLVPANAIFSDGAERYVFVEETSTKESSEYRKKPVVVGRRNGEWAEVVSGDIFPGDRVVTQGGHELSSLFFLGVLRLSEATSKSIGLALQPVALQPVERVVRLEGLVEVPPQNRTTIYSQLGGTIKRIRVDRSQPVKAGDVLLEIASLELQDIQLELLRAHLDESMWRETLARRQSAGEAIQRRSVLETEGFLRAAEGKATNLKQKLLSLGLTTAQIEDVLSTGEVVDAVPLRAPFDGFVVEFLGTLGQAVRPDEPLLDVQDLSHVWVQAFVGTRDGDKVAPGQRARLRLVADGAFEATGEVVRMGPIVEADSRTQAAWIEFDQPPARVLLNNMLVTATLTAAVDPPTLAVPRTAVASDGLRSYLFVKSSNGEFHRRLVEIGRADDRFVQILRGVKPGELVATSGVPQLQTAYAAVR